MNSTDETLHCKWMARAIELAKKGLYTTHPNPRVGCVLTRDNQLLAEGFHYKAGEGHAEVNALAAAKGDTQGATVYVTLEPCSHQGKTPPCADALIKAGVACVVFGMQDPNPDVAGRGLAKLRDAGIEVIGPVLAEECAALNLGFIKRMTEGLPFVRVKLAMSLDGRTAMESGESQWITGAEARHDVQQLRAQSDAIVTGIGSVIIDNPSMTVRINDNNEPVEPHQVRQPKRVVMDTSLSIPPDAKILSPAEQACVFCLSEQIEVQDKKLLEDQGVCVIEGEADETERIDLVEAMAYLADEGINEVLVETGAGLAGAFLEAGLVDEIVVYMAPKLLGASARPLFNLQMDNMSQAIDLRLSSVSQVGKDVKCVLTPCYEDA